jgi:23S rRNA pseudouridine1911/1915/1917 synthase
MREKAYKLLAIQEKISNNKAKELIDRGLVYIGSKKVKIARGLVEPNTKFKVLTLKEPVKIFEDKYLLVIDKPSKIDSYELEARYRYKLLHRLDFETSGLLVLCKDENFRKKAIEEYKKNRVYKRYKAVVSGKVYEEITIDAPILTIKKNSTAFSKISHQKGKSAVSRVYPDLIVGNESKIDVVIESGRTHQIRVHLSSINHPIIGDEKYGGKNTRRLMLHFCEMKLFDYHFLSNEPDDFGFSS